MSTQLLTANELADCLQVRPSTIRRWTRERRIPTIRLTRKVVRYELEAVVMAMSKGRDPQAVAHD